jgi:hypothetical protein
MASAKNSQAAGPRRGPPATEYKLPIFDCRLARPALPVSSFQFRISSFHGQGRWAEEKKFTNEATKLLKTKDH